MGGLVAVEDRDDLGSQGAYLGEGVEECPGDGREATEWRGAGHHAEQLDALGLAQVDEAQEVAEDGELVRLGLGLGLRLRLRFAWA